MITNIIYIMKNNINRLYYIILNYIILIKLLIVNNKIDL